MYKKFVFKFLLIFIIIYLLLTILYIVIDPYYENSYIDSSFNNTKIKVNEYSVRSLIKELLNNKSILVVGTSRSAKFSEKIINDNIVNLYSVYAHPSTVYELFTQHLSDREMKNIKKIYYLLDIHIFNSEGYQKVPIKNISNLSYIFHTLNSLNFSKLIDVTIVAIENMFNINLKSSKLPKLRFKKGAVVTELYTKKPKDYVFEINVDFDKYMNVEDSELRYLKKIDTLFKEKKLEVIYFSPIFPIEYLKEMKVDRLEKNRKRVLEVIDNYYEFSYVDFISNNKSYFSDDSHLSIEGFTKLVELLNNKNNRKVNIEDIDLIFNYYKREFGK